ncbi:mCG1034776 [Mus musculus]|nr:mCG1034776 [Mus musculus]
MCQKRPPKTNKP